MAIVTQFNDTADINAKFVDNNTYTEFSGTTVINTKFTVPASDVLAGALGTVTLKAQALGVPYELRALVTEAEASQIAAFASEQVATAKATESSDSAQAALVSEQSIEASALAVTASEVATGEDVVASTASAQAATTSQDKAQQWAEELEDVAVETGQYSSLHHAIKSEDSAIASALSETNAGTSETNAGDSETAAALSESNASGSESAASLSAGDAATSESNASTSAGAANSAETAAQLAETGAVASESAAATSESNASTYETNAAGSASASSVSANEAQASESAAAASETASSTSELNAKDSETAANTSSDLAQAARIDAEAARDTTEALVAQFGDQYLGDAASDPTVDNSGNPLTAGDVYLNTSDNELKFYSGSVWVSPESVATTAASNAQTSASNAASSETNAVTSETNSATSAVTSASEATDSASSASVSATSESNASQSASAASASEANAMGSENAAAVSETNATNSESASSTSETNANDSSIESQNWATTPEDTLVPEGDQVTDFSAMHWSRKAEAYATSIDLPDPAGQGGKAIARTRDETGFEYVELPHPVSKRQCVLGGPLNAEGKADFLSLAGNIVSLSGVDVNNPLAFTIGAGFHIAGDKNYVGVLTESLDWDLGTVYGFLNDSSLHLFLDIDPITQAVTPVVTATPPNFSVTRPMKRKLTRAHTTQTYVNHGEVSASSDYSAIYNSHEAFDGVRHTTATGNNAWISGNGSSPLPQWLAYRWQGQLRGVVVDYLVHNRDQSRPKSWTLEGSNDSGATWTVVDTRTNVTDVGEFTSVTYTVATPGAYNLYKLVITETYSTNDNWKVGVAELELNGYFEDEFFYHIDHIGLPQVFDAVNGWQDKHRIYVGRVPVQTDGTLQAPRSASLLAKEYYPRFLVNKGELHVLNHEIGTDMCDLNMYVINTDSSEFPSMEKEYWRKMNFHYYSSGSSMGIYPRISRYTTEMRVSNNYVYYAKYAGGPDETWQASAYLRVFLERQF